MKKKYIIELEDNVTLWGFFTDTDGEIAVVGVIKQPYTEPDLEQVRKEAYADGYNTGFGRKIDASYQEGLADAWEAVRKIIHMPEGDLLNVFTECYSAVCTALQVILKYDASEVIEKLKAYEQDRETIQVGDVVRVKNAPDVEIWVTDISDEDGGLLSGLALKTVDDNCDMGDTYANRNIYNFERTGKHYDVPTVLEKMRGEQDG